MEERAAAYEGFAGHVEREMSRSTPWWPSRPDAPSGAPNVVVVLVDDMGWSDLACYGSEIPTPHVDALAAQGVQFTNFHAQPSCSPTRASLLTGQECHAAGFGFPANFDPGFPGYAMELPDDVLSMAEVFRANGYATFMTGKWHLSREADGVPGGSRASWPVARGFDRFYGFLDGFTDHLQPHQLVVDNTVLEIDEHPEGYYLADDLTDRAIAMIRDTTVADPARPFFCYLAHGAVHAPLQAKPEELAPHLERYHGGWDELRAERFARQQALGVLDDGAALPPRNHEPGNDVAAWDDLDADERRLHARYMAVYAAMVENVDRNLGRLLAALDELGRRENTIVVLLSDNGASREGGAQGTTSYIEGIHAAGFGSDLAADLARLDLIGSARVHAHYPRGWAMVSNTPNRLYKITTHAGGHKVPCVMAWPAGLAGTGIRRQYAHVVDLLPTFVDLLGLRVPSTRAGRPARPFAGTSLASVLADPAAPATHTEQHYESIGSRGYYRDGWEVVSRHLIGAPFEDATWELYDLTTDPSEVRDRAAEEPARVAELVAAFDDAAWRNGVYPIVDDYVHFAGNRPPSDARLLAPLRLRVGDATVDRYRAAVTVQDRPFTITATLDWQPGDEGVVVTHGSLGGGYELTIEDGCPVWTHNARTRVRREVGAPLVAGTRALRVEVAAPAPGRLDVRILADGRPVLEVDDLGAFGGMAPLEGIDVGRSRRSPVSWERQRRHGAFAYTGALHLVEYVAGPTAPFAAASVALARRQRLTTFD